MRLRLFTLIGCSVTLLFSSSGCATRQARDEHAAQKHALETMTPAAVAAPAARPTSETRDSDLVRALENLEPAQ